MAQISPLLTISGLIGQLARTVKSVPSSLLPQNVADIHDRKSNWDYCIDSLNRLPRPLITLGTIAMMVWPAINPRTFAEAMQSYAMMPDWLVQLVMAIVLAYFATRTVEKIREKPSMPETSSPHTATSQRNAERAPVVDGSATRKIPESQA